jgi:acetyl esterase/lipase
MIGPEFRMRNEAFILPLSAATAVSALAAIIRARSGSLRGLVCFVVGFPAFQFTNALLLVGAITIACAVTLGMIDTVPGKLTIVFDILAIAALLALRVRAHRIAPTAIRALEESLGADYRAPASFTWLSRYPWRSIPRNIQRIGDLSYGNAGKRNLLDLYRPREAARGNLPIFLWIHGGAWTVGHKRQQGLPLLYNLANRGWLTVSVNYRLGPRNRFPDPLVDIKRAIAWLRANGPHYGADPEFVIVGGGSAGGHLAALAALTPNNPRYQPNFETVDTTLIGAVPLYGRFDFIDRIGALPNRSHLISFLQRNVMPCRYVDDPSAWDEASPLTLARSDAPPMFVVHGTHDSLIPLAEAEAFVAVLREHSMQPVAFAQLRGAQHGWDLFNSTWTEHTVNAVHSFCEYLYCQYAKGRTGNRQAN